jgi:uncharacterized protein
MYKKWNCVLEQLKQLDSSVIAFSGGTDSSLLLQAAAQSKIRAIAVTARAEIFPSKAMSAAEQTASAFGIPHLFVEFDIYQITQFASNPQDRCYHCKKSLISLMKKAAAENNFRYILDGTNADDIGDYRPGLKALTEEGVISPLKEAGLTKKEILLLADEFNVPATPSDACLASRVPYGETITHVKLNQIEQGESFLHTMGFNQCRVRHHGNTARIELKAGDIERLVRQKNREKILAHFGSLGFTYTSIDLRGYVTGSMNKPLRKETLPWKTKE